MSQHDHQKKFELELVLGSVVCATASLHLIVHHDSDALQAASSKSRSKEQVEQDCEKRFSLLDLP